MKRLSLIKAGSTAAVVLSLVSACSLQPARQAETPIQRPVASTFELEGRISATDGHRAASGRLGWKHAPGTDEWTVFNPLGQVAAQLVSTPSGAELRTAEGRRVQAAHISVLMPQVVGVPVPLDGLSHWVQASVRNGARVLALDDAGRPRRISDEGWIIDYQEYVDASADAPPRRIDAHWGDARLRLVIDQWTPVP